MSIFSFLTTQGQDYRKCIRYYREGSYDSAVALFEQITELRAALFDSLELLDAVTTSYIHIGNSLAAKRYLTSYQRDQRSTVRKPLSEALVFNNLGLVYDEQLHFDSALYCLNRGLKLRTAAVGKAHLLTAESYFNLGSLFSKVGEESKAEELLLRALQIEMAHYQPDDPSLALTYNNLGVVNEDAGRFRKALNFYQRASAIFFLNPGPESFEYGLLQFNKSKAFAKLGLADSSLLSLKEAQQVFNNLDYVLPEMEVQRITQAKLWIKQQQYAKADSLMRQIAADWVPGAPADIQHHLALARSQWALKQGRMEEAQQWAAEALNLFLRIFSERHSAYLELLNHQADLYFLQGNNTSGRKNLDRILALSHARIVEYFPSLSENERELYFASVKPYFEKYSSLLHSQEGTKGVAGNLYNSQLITKAILLNYTSRWKTQLLNSGDFELIRQFTQWQEMKAKLHLATEKPIEGKGHQLDSLEEEVNLIEKRLTSRSENFAHENADRSVTWRDIQRTLKKNEAAVEIVRYRTYDFSTSAFTDEVRYAALIVTRHTKNDPQVVLLAKGAELEARVLRQYRNSIVHRVADSSSYLYLWKPLKEKLKHIERVFISPDGIFNLVNFNTLLNPESGKYLVDEMDVRLVTNTKDLLSQQPTELRNHYALLFGGPDYESRASLEYTSTRKWLPTTRSYILPELSRGSYLTYLPGARKEAESIQQLLEEHQWEVDFYEGQNALEDHLKHSLKPRVLHIATHGYFKPDASTGENERGAETILTRSGLMFAGAATSLTEDGNVSDLGDQEDGILTAYEAMNLNLENTELVVLSACETGLGEVQNGEGVYGLQRAFRVAGARHLMMSLWKVDDEVTRMLMEEFYKNWLQSNDKHDAFRKAQRLVKARHPEPFYWGAFVLVGN